MFSRLVAVMVLVASWCNVMVAQAQNLLLRQDGNITVGSARLEDGSPVQ